MGNGSELSFHLDAEGGLEFVFSSGRQKDLSEHTHMSTSTITLVRSGRARLSPKPGAAVYTAGAVYAIAPHQPHQPEYRAGYDLVSLCLKLKLLAALTPRQRRDLCGDPRGSSPGKRPPEPRGSAPADGGPGQTPGLSGYSRSFAFNLRLAGGLG